MTCLEYINNAKSVLGNYLPPAIRYLNIGTFVEDISINTMMLDNTHAGKLFIRFNPNWLMNLKIQELTRLLCDISTKICLHHCTKRKVFNKYGLIASDIICNRFVSAAGIITNIDFSDVFDRTKMNEMKIKAQMKYKEIHGEDYYEDDFVMEKLAYYLSLTEENNEGNGNEQNDSNDDCDDDEDDESNDEGSKSNGKNDDSSNEDSDDFEDDYDDEDEDDSNSSQSDSNGSEESEQKNSNGGNSSDKNSSAVEEYYNDMTRADKWNENLYTKDMTEMETSNMDKNGMLSGTRWGLCNSNLMKRIIKANKPPVDTALILKQFMGGKKTSNRVQTYAKPNRRLGIEYPGSKKVRKRCFCVFGDASGSMGDLQLSQVMDLILDIAKKHCDVDYAWWDCSCDTPTKLKSSKVSKEGVDVSKGGGTDPNCIFKMLHDKKLKNKYNGIIIVSDMIFNMDKPTNFDMNKVFWVGTTCSANPPSFVKKNRFLSADNVKESLNRRKK